MLKHLKTYKFVNKKEFFLVSKFENFIDSSKITVKLSFGFGCVIGSRDDGPTLIRCRLSTPIPISKSSVTQKIVSNAIRNRRDGRRWCEIKLKNKISSRLMLKIRKFVSAMLIIRQFSYARFVSLIRNSANLVCILVQLILLRWW